MILLMSGMTKNLVLRIILFFLGYFESIVRTYVFVIIFGLVSVLVIGTGLEETFVKILALSPGIGLGKKGSFIVDSSSIMLFFLFWGTVVYLVSGILEKYTKIRIHFGERTLLAVGLILHIVSLYVLSIRFGFGFSAMFIGSLFVTYLFGLFWSIAIKYSKKLLEAAVKK